MLQAARLADICMWEHSKAGWLSVLFQDLYGDQMAARPALSRQASARHQSVLINTQDST